MPGSVEMLVLYAAAVVALIAFVLVLSHCLGERSRAAATGEPFESGIRPTTPARLPVSVRFYVVAMLFVIFDLEAVFVFAWALVAREAGWAGYVEIVVFVGILLAGLAYLWRVGALDWGTGGRRRPPPPGHWTRAEDPPMPAAAEARTPRAIPDRA